MKAPRMVCAVTNEPRYNRRGEVPRKKSVINVTRRYIGGQKGRQKCNFRRISTIKKRLMWVGQGHINSRSQITDLLDSRDVTHNVHVSPPTETNTNQYESAISRNADNRENTIFSLQFST